MKFKTGQIVEHKISKERYVVVKCKLEWFTKRPYYRCTQGKYDDEIGFYEDEITAYNGGTN